jgi:hypothetical protein
MQEAGRLAVRGLPGSSPAAGRTTLPALRRAPRVVTCGVRVPGAASRPDAPSLGGRLRGPDRGGDPSLQIPGLEAPGRAARRAHGRAPGRGGPGRAGDRGGPAASRTPATARLQPGGAARPSAAGEAAGRGGGWAFDANSRDAASGRPRPPLEGRQRQGRLPVGRAASQRSADRGGRRCGDDRRDPGRLRSRFAPIRVRSRYGDLNREGYRIVPLGLSKRSGG